MLRTGKSTLLIVNKPDTLLRWHRAGFRIFWKAKSAITSSRQPKVAVEIIALIKQRAQESWLWGAERIRGALLKLDIRVAKRTIQKYLEAARQQRQYWQQAGVSLEVAVNLSMSGLHEAGLVDTTLTLLQRYDVPPAALRLELTESALMQDAARTREILMQLAAFGVRRVIDDFGTGYSSLAYRKQLPVEEIKIDRSFVQDLVSAAADAAIISSIIGLGHGLGLRVIAEGVETAQVRERGGDGAQGYYSSHPLPAEALTAGWGKAPGSRAGRSVGAARALLPVPPPQGDAAAVRIGGRPGGPGSGRVQGGQQGRGGDDPPAV